MILSWANKQTLFSIVRDPSNPKRTKRKSQILSGIKLFNNLGMFCPGVPASAPGGMQNVCTLQSQSVDCFSGRFIGDDHFADRIAQKAVTFAGGCGPIKAFFALLWAHIGGHLGTANRKANRHQRLLRCWLNKFGRPILEMGSSWHCGGRVAGKLLSPKL